MASMPSTVRLLVRRGRWVAISEGNEDASDDSGDDGTLADVLAPLSLGSSRLDFVALHPRHVYRLLRPTMPRHHKALSVGALLVSWQGRSHHPMNTWMRCTACPGPLGSSMTGKTRS